jgi:hypothetical protein
MGKEVNSEDGLGDISNDKSASEGAAQGKVQTGGVPTIRGDEGSIGCLKVVAGPGAFVTELRARDHAEF